MLLKITIGIIIIIIIMHFIPNFENTKHISLRIENFINILLDAKKKNYIKAQKEKNPKSEKNTEL